MTALMLMLPVPTAHAAEQQVTVGVLGNIPDPDIGAKTWLVDVNRRDPKGNCPFLFMLMQRQPLLPTPLPMLQPGRTYQAVIGVVPDGGGLMHSITVDGVVYDVGLSNTFTCDPRPAPDGGHWVWENGNVAIKPGAADPIPWLAGGAAASANEPADYVRNVVIENQLDAEVTVTMDGQTGCTAQAHRKCSFRAAYGSHRFMAVSPAVDEPAYNTHELNPGLTFTWTIWLEH